MSNYCQYALKEWSVTIHSLLAGRQIMLFRKGGIHEQREGFQVEHSEFFLFPTYLHQNYLALHSSFRSQFDSHNGVKAPTVTLNTYAEVQELIPIANLGSLQGLDGLHTLDWTTVKQRFAYRNRPGLNLVLLRVYRLPVPRSITNLKRYEGCASWVELDEALPTAGAEPVLPTRVFEDQVQEIRRLVGAPSLAEEGH